MKRILIIGILSILTKSLNAQIATTTSLMDSSSSSKPTKLSIEGYMDLYYAYDFNQPEDGNRPYFVSMARHNEVNLNLAYIALKYSSTRVRAHLIPGFGTYMNANYQSESGSMKYLVEANAGIKISQAIEIWIDAGILASPFTNESAISRDQLAYTRSLSSEYSPYYLSGVKLSFPLPKKLNAYLYLINGWQQIQDQNKKKSICTQLEYHPTSNWLINWNTYIGNESSETHPEFGTRYFTDAYVIYTNEKWSASGSAYGGLQERNDIHDATWWQLNITGLYKLTEKLTVTGRLEYFSDPDEVQVTPITSVNGFSSYNSSAGANLSLADNILIRFEARYFFASDNVYLRNSDPVRNSFLLTSNITVWF